MNRRRPRSRQRPDRRGPRGCRRLRSCRCRETRSARPTSSRRRCRIPRCPGSIACCGCRRRAARRPCISRPDRAPSVRVDGELQMLDGEPVLSARDVESLLLTLMPERSHEALRTGAATEWILRHRWRRPRPVHELPRSPRAGRRVPPDADAFGLGRSARAAAPGAGAGDRAGRARARGRSALERQAHADVGVRRSDQPHAPRSRHHDRARDQHRPRARPARSSASARCAATTTTCWRRRARRCARTPTCWSSRICGPAALMNVALEAAAAGRLVVGGFSAHTATGAIDRIIDLYAARVPPAGAARAGRLAARRHRAGAAAKDRRRPRARARGAAQHAGGVERDRRRQDVAAADGDRRRAAIRHDAAQRRARRPRAERSSSTSREAYRRVARSSGLPRRAQAPGHRHVVRRAPRDKRPDRAAAAPHCSPFDERFELLQQKRQHVVFGQRAGRAERSLGFEHAAAAAAAGVADRPAARRPSCRANSSMKSSASRSDISRTLPDGVKTLKRVTLRREAPARPAGRAAPRSCRGTARTRAVASSLRARRSAACALRALDRSAAVVCERRRFPWRV